MTIQRSAPGSERGETYGISADQPQPCSKHDKWERSIGADGAIQSSSRLHLLLCVHPFNGFRLVSTARNRATG